MASFGPGALTQVALNDVIEVKMVAVKGGQLSLNVRHYKCTVLNGTGATLGQVAASADTAFEQLYKNLMCSAARWLGVSARIITTPPGSGLAFNKDNTGFGIRAGDQLPTQVAGIITLQTALGGRRNRGRLYVPFPDETANTEDNIPSAGYLTDLEILGDQLVTALTAGPGGGNNVILTAVLYHRGNGSTTPLIAHRDNTRWATQRRRGDYGAMNVVPF